MASYQETRPSEDAGDAQIWTSSVQLADELPEEYTLYVVSEDEFHYFRFRDEDDQTDALRAFVHGGDERDVTEARQAVSVELDDILRVERLPGKDCFYIQYEHDGKRRWAWIACPSNLAVVLFRGLRERLRLTMRLGQARQTVVESLVLPLSALFVVLLVTFMVWAGAKSADAPGNQPVGRDRGSRAVAGARMIGKQLGPTGSLAIGGVATLGVLSWAAFAVASRPMKKVLMPRRKNDKAEDEDEEDGAGSKERKRPARRVRKPQARGRKQLIFGLVALGIGLLALALSWLSSIGVTVLIAALVGLVLGIVGVRASSDDYGEGQGLPVAGAGVNILALIVVVVVMYQPPKPTDDGNAQAANNQNAPGVNNPGGNNPAGNNNNPAGNNNPQPGNNNPPPGNQNPGPGGQNAVNKSFGEWGEAVDPNGDCSFSIRGNGLAIDVPNTLHGLVENGGKFDFTAPRVVQELEGDFVIQVKVCGILHPFGKANAPGLTFQAAGLLIWDGPDHFVRFVRSGQDRKGEFQSVVAFTQRESGKMVGAGPTTVPERDVYLKMERRGNQILGSYSLDGNTWTNLTPLEGKYPPKVAVGVMAINGAHKGLNARFEELQVGR